MIGAALATNAVYLRREQHAGDAHLANGMDALEETCPRLQFLLPYRLLAPFDGARLSAFAAGRRIGGQSAAGRGCRAFLLRRRPKRRLCARPRLAVAARRPVVSRSLDACAAQSFGCRAFPLRRRPKRRLCARPEACGDCMPARRFPIVGCVRGPIFWLPRVWSASNFAPRREGRSGGGMGGAECGDAHPQRASGRRRLFKGLRDGRLAACAAKKRGLPP